MEEQQIRDFVHRVSTEEGLRAKVAQVVMRLVPHLAMTTSFGASPNAWWSIH